MGRVTAYLRPLLKQLDMWCSPRLLPWIDIFSVEQYLDARSYEQRRTDEWERQNILEAYGWALDKRNLNRTDPLSEAYVRQLHLRMFDQTWQWAGVYRTTEKNIGIPHHQIRDSLAALLADARYWLENKSFEPDEIGVRVHHRLVWIHPFVIGNGRHARLMADVLAQRQSRPLFTWGSADITRSGDFRRSYIDALRAADKNNIQPLLSFARS